MMIKVKLTKNANVSDTVKELIGIPNQLNFYEEKVIKRETKG